MHDPRVRVGSITEVDGFGAHEIIFAEDIRIKCVFVTVRVMGCPRIHAHEGCIAKYIEIGANVGLVLVYIDMAGKKAAPVTIQRMVGVDACRTASSIAFTWNQWITIVMFRSIPHKEKVKSSRGAYYATEKVVKLGQVGRGNIIENCPRLESYVGEGHNGQDLRVWQ